MNILFLSISKAISNINNRGIYPDLLRYFASQGHHIYIVCPFERKDGKKTSMSTVNDSVHILGVRTLNLTKTNLLEKGLGTLLLQRQYYWAINKHFDAVNFDLVLYTTPPITFNSLIRKLKSRGAKTYLMLKDIFPQNAVDLGVLKKDGFIYRYFRKKEIALYQLSDTIGCMSPANVDYVLKENPWLDPKRVEVCPNSIELRENKPAADPDVIRKKYDLPENACICIYGGNLGAPQGIDFLIEVLAANQNRRDVFFIVAGSGTEYGKLQKFMSGTAPENVRLLPFLAHAEYDELMRISDIGLIFLSARFTIPNFPSRLLAYLENKMPVLLATDSNTDIGKIAETNGFGLWARSGEMQEYNSKLNWMVSDVQGRTEMGEKGFAFLTANYLVEHSYQRIMNSLEAS